jgi:hypothetical protein
MRRHPEVLAALAASLEGWPQRPRPSFETPRKRAAPQDDGGRLSFRLYQARADWRCGIAVLGQSAGLAGVRARRRGVADHAGLFVTLFRRTFGFDDRHMPLFVFMAGSPFFFKNFMHTLGHFDIYGCALRSSCC